MSTSLHKENSNSIMAASLGFPHSFLSLSVNNQQPVCAQSWASTAGETASRKHSPLPQGVFSGFGQHNKPPARSHNEITSSGREFIGWSSCQRGESGKAAWRGAALGLLG